MNNSQFKYHDSATKAAEVMRRDAVLAFKEDHGKIKGHYIYSETTLTAIVHHLLKRIEELEEKINAQKM